MFDLILRDAFRRVSARRNYPGWFLGPSLLREFDEIDYFNPPRVDVSENEDGFELSAELPGFDKDDISIAVENEHLTLRAEHKDEKEEDKENYRVRERRSGTYYRRFHLPDNVDGERIEAGMEKGVLKLTLPKKEETKPKRIEVQVH